MSQPGPRVPAGATLVITAPQIVTGLAAEILSPGYVVLTDGQVTEAGAGSPPAGADIELPDGVLAPGFVDLQVNGFYGEEFMAASPEGWARVIGRLPETGTTAFVPTFITAPVDQLVAAFSAAASFWPGLPAGARVLGIHLEGPFIAPARRGAHNPDWIIDPAPDAIERLLAAAGGHLRLLTLAPERPGALAAITQLTGAGVLVSVGHTDATAAQVAAAADAGARMVTHLYDAQRGLHHREPGVVGQALTDPRLTSGLITDLHHVSAAACQIAFAAAPGRIVIVTDAAACSGMPAGRYLLGGEPIELPDEPGAPPVRADGTLAGSALRMDVAVGNMVASGVPLVTAVAAATRIPADLIGCPGLGRIAPGAAGDLVWLGRDLRARATWIGGRQVSGARAGAAGS
ncbi:MAG TPA: N-acetylglucosamine-6-phosphate deacetylase [Streptosporangiaceae bacterium]|nr:N-acetylglucosamine-6-phosphate deacetylase [Streptosporangiaceae bacterium]